MNILYCPPPVSYTHLDVYKRQLHSIYKILKPFLRRRHRILCNKYDIFAGSFRSSKISCFSMSEFGSRYLIQFTGIFFDRWNRFILWARIYTNAVSYTHLDVYKRQILHIIIRLQIIRFCSFHNTVNDCGRLSSIDRIDHPPILFPNTKTTDCSFRCIIINRNISICEKYTEIFFLIQCIADSITKFILLGYVYGFKVCKNASSSGLITACHCLSRSSEERSFSFPSSR